MLHRISIPLALALMTACSGHLDVGSTGDSGAGVSPPGSPPDSEAGVSPPGSTPDVGAGVSPTDASPAANPPLDGGPAATLAQVSGTPGGQAFAPSYAVAFKGVSDPAYPNQVSVFITDISNLCELAQTGGQASFRALVFVVGQTDSAAPPIEPGTYTQGGSTNEGTVTYDDMATILPPPAPNGVECSGFGGSGVGGSIVISSAGASIAGMFNGTVGTGQPVTATFDAPLCDLPASNGIISLCL